MFTHIFLGAQDLEASRKFYDAALGALGHAPGTEHRQPLCVSHSHRHLWHQLSHQRCSRQFGNGSTFGFAAKSEAEVNAFHAAGIANGGVTCEDPPGLRTNPAFSYYIAYLRDPSGNKICAMYRPAK